MLQRAGANGSWWALGLVGVEHGACRHNPAGKLAGSLSQGRSVGSRASYIFGGSQQYLANNVEAACGFKQALIDPGPSLSAAVAASAGRRVWQAQAQAEKVLRATSNGRLTSAIHGRRGSPADRQTIDYYHRIIACTCRRRRIFTGFGFHGTRDTRNRSGRARGINATPAFQSGLATRRC